jgi:hypothetical protein
MSIERPEPGTYRRKRDGATIAVLESAGNNFWKKYEKTD